MHSVWCLDRSLAQHFIPQTPSASSVSHTPIHFLHSASSIPAFTTYCQPSQERSLSLSGMHRLNSPWLGAEPGCGTIVSRGECLSFMALYWYTHNYPIDGTTQAKVQLWRCYRLTSRRPMRWTFVLNMAPVSSAALSFVHEHAVDTQWGPQANRASGPAIWCYLAISAHLHFEL